jgi:hypothetical protein
MKILSNKEYEDLKKLATVGQTVLQDYCWYSEYTFLNPIFDSFTGRSSYAVSSAREGFRARLSKEYITRHDHDIALHQMAASCKQDNKFPETNTFHRMNKQLTEALAVIEEFKKVKLPEMSQQ